MGPPKETKKVESMRRDDDWLEREGTAYVDIPRFRFGISLPRSCQQTVFELQTAQVAEQLTRFLFYLLSFLSANSTNASIVEPG